MAFDKHASPDTNQYHIQVARGMCFCLEIRFART